MQEEFIWVSMVLAGVFLHYLDSLGGILSFVLRLSVAMLVSSIVKTSYDIRNRNELRNRNRLTQFMQLSQSRRRARRGL